MKLVICLLLILIIWVDVFSQQRKALNIPTGTLKVIFKNLTNNKPVVLYDSSYTNSFGESYQLNKLKYYVSNVTLLSGFDVFRFSEKYHLINQQIDSSLIFLSSTPIGEYQSFNFLLGVDSAANESGAQTGALDPLNDMFWTWQSGYVMLKMEGTSSQSKVINNKFEYHLGGYKGINSVLGTVRLPVPLHVMEGKTTTIVINADIDKLWNAITPIKITETALCNTPGELAKQIAANCRQMFSIAEVINEK